MSTTDGIWVFREFNGKTYRCKKLPCLAGLQLATEMARYLGSPLFTAVMAAADDDTDPMALIRYLLTDGLVGVPPHVAQDLMLRVMAAVIPAGSNTPLGTEKEFEKEFWNVDHLATALEIWVWAAQENFRTFLAAVLSRISSQRETATATPES